MLQAPAIFHARNGYFYNNPPNAPPLYSKNIPGANTADRECLSSEHKLLYVHWAKYVHTGRIAVNIGAATFDEWVLAAIEDPNVGLNEVTICDVYDYVMDNYATILQAKVNSNLDTFNEHIDSRCNLAVYICNQELCQEMAKDTNVPITNATMVATSTKYVVSTAGIDDAWRGWMRLPSDQQILVR